MDWSKRSDDDGRPTVGDGLSRLLEAEQRLDAELEAARTHCRAVVERARVATRDLEQEEAAIGATKLALEHEAEVERTARLREIEVETARRSARFAAVEGERADELGRQLLSVLVERIVAGGGRR